MKKMAFQPVPGVALAELIFDMFGQTVENTLYFEHTGGLAWTETELNDLAVALGEWWADNLRPLVTDGCTLREIVCTDLTTSTGFQISLSTLDAGTLVNPGLPTNVTFCISFRTELRGRSYRGRNYFIGLTENRVVGDTIDSAHALAIVAGYGQIPIYIDPLGPDAVWVVVSRVQEGVELEEGIATPVDTVIAVDEFVDSQRRRLEGRGE